MINCFPALILCPSAKLFCFLIPCATFLGMMGVYIGGLFSYYSDVAYVKINEFVNNTSI